MRKKNKTILFIGRFQPFHNGHLGVIKKYSSKGYFVKIGIGSAQKYGEIHNPFNIQERECMIKLALANAKIKNYSIFQIPDIVNDRDYSKYVIKIVGEFDCIITGNKWIKRCFKNNNLCDIYYFNEDNFRIKNIKAGDIRKSWTEKNNSKGLSIAVYNYLKKIGTVDRLKELNDPILKAHYILKTNNLTISCAESCTGGLIGNTLITHSGASEFFKGGIIAYTNEIKNKILKVPNKILLKYTAVSPQIAFSMARNVKRIFNSTYGISSTGYADPSSKYSGLIFIAVSGKYSEYILEINCKLKARKAIIEYANHQAILFLENILEKELLR